MLWALDCGLLVTGSADGTMQFTKLYASNTTYSSLTSAALFSLTGDNEYMNISEDEYLADIVVEMVWRLYLVAPVEGECF